MKNKIHLKIEDKNEKLRKELECLRHELNLNNNKEVVKHIILNYKKLLLATSLNCEVRKMYKITYSDQSTTIILLSKKELIDFKKTVQFSEFTNEDVTVRKAVLYS
ncbi:hypothetical protein [Tenacibaculum ovolyticum]|uniref:hypothetical protein n=1 Tax=Tenacibaculum ovolyticum TaxID=104270 RepID=UPI001F1EA01B|nr:hypothetical protein [Tenacibaculum ovolyticum]